MGFQYIIIRQVPLEVLKTAASANVNAWKLMFDPYNEVTWKRP